MCGFAGFFEHKSSFTSEELTRILIKMTDAIRHRGPDDSGLWSDPACGVGFGFRRLSILDLSSEGHQPMRSASGRLVMMFNGEVYNHAALRRELEGLGHEFRGHSDTEVMLAAIEQWGLKVAVPRFWGMFAFALWDMATHQLHLGRDRLGKKPLYYGWQGGAFLFGSELKALRLHPNFRGDLNRDALALYMRHNCVPGPHSIYQGIHKLLPGCTLSLNPSQVGVEPEPEPYWDPRAMAEQGEAHPFEGTDHEAFQGLEALLKDAVKLRMMADVPVGAFLSGGIDSSLVVSLMQAQSTRPVRTFTLGFDQFGYNEAHYARAVATHLGTTHTELFVQPEHARDVIPLLPQIYDEPFADSSQIPTFLVSQLAKRDVTVVLSGDGGDELFGGYNRYSLGLSMIGGARHLSRPLLELLVTVLRKPSTEAWNRVLKGVERVLPKRYRQLVSGERLHKLAQLLSCDGPMDLYRQATTHWSNPASLVFGSREPLTPMTDPVQQPDLSNPAHLMMYFDLITYLVDDILVKVDRATMAVSLEGRAPLLDHRVAEYAWRLPHSMKIRNGRGKYPLRYILDRYIPRELMERPKQGFGIPIGVWLRGPLRDWAEHLLDAKKLEQEGVFNPELIRSKWGVHLSEGLDCHFELWDVLMFQAWQDSLFKPSV